MVRLLECWPNTRAGLRGQQSSVAQLRRGNLFLHGGYAEIQACHPCAAGGAGSKFDNDPAYGGGQAAPSPQQPQPYGQQGYGGAAGGSKFDPDPTYGGGGGGSAYNPAPSYGPTPTYGGVSVGGVGGGGSKFDAEPAVRVGSSGLVSKFDNDPSFSVPTVNYSGPTQYDSGSQWSASAQVPLVSVHRHPFTVPSAFIACS
jgi:hypothetical protein